MKIKTSAIILIIASSLVILSNYDVIDTFKDFPIYSFRRLLLPIVLLFFGISFLNDKYNRYGDKSQIISDINLFSFFETISDKIILLHLPDLIVIIEDTEGKSKKNIVKLYITGNNNGELKKIKLKA